MKESLIKYKKTKKGMSAHIYGQQRASSKKRGHDYPSFTLEEFREGLFNYPTFSSLYDKWVASNYCKDLRPSPDRLDDKLSYSFSNLQLLTWKGNKENAYKLYSFGRLNAGEGCVYFSNHGKAWIAKIHHNKKEVQVKRSKDKQVVIDALEQWKKDNRI